MQRNFKSQSKWNGTVPHNQWEKILDTALKIHVVKQKILLIKSIFLIPQKFLFFCFLFFFILKQKDTFILALSFAYLFHRVAAAAAKSLQSCPTLYDPLDGSPPGSPVPGILQARTLEWVAISFSNACKWKVKVKLLSHVQFFATPWTAAYQAPPSMGFSRLEYWSSHMT